MYLQGRSAGSDKTVSPEAFVLAMQHDVVDLNAQSNSNIATKLTEGMVFLLYLLCTLPTKFAIVLEDFGSLPGISLQIDSISKRMGITHYNSFLQLSLKISPKSNNFVKPEIKFGKCTQKISHKVIH